MAPRYKVALTIDEREFLETLIHTGSTDAKKFVKARALLLCEITYGILRTFKIEAAPKIG